MMGPAGTGGRLRVLVVSHMFPTDDRDNHGLFVREQVEALAEYADVSVAVGRFAGSPQEVCAPRGVAVIESIPLARPALLPNSVGTAWAVPAYFRGARSLAARIGSVDVVHAHFGFPDGVVGVRLARALGVPSVVTLHGSDFNRQMARPVVGALVGSEIARADLVVSCSPAIVEGMSGRFGLPGERSVFLANGYNARDITIHSVRSPKYFLFVGALNRQKNPDVLLEAFACVAGRVGLNLVMVGTGPMLGQLMDRAAELGLDDRVCFKGKQAHTEINGLLAHAAALVLPSSSEGMPIVVNEALASGTPVIATRLPGTEIQVHSEELGILLHAPDVEALAEALLSCDSRCWDYSQIAQRSGVLSWDAYARHLAEAYRELVEGGCGR